MSILRKTLFILTYVSFPIEKKYFSKLNLLKSLSQLVEKRLVENKGGNYNIHEKYKPFFRSYTLNDNEFKEIMTALTIISETEIEIVLDTIRIYIEYNLPENAFSILKSSFSRLIHYQLFKKTLKLVQDIEEVIIDNRFLIELCKMKIILLERLSQYGLCVQYLAMIESDIDLCSDHWEDIYYIKLRCLYFTNRYDELLCSFSTNRNYILEQMKEELRIQILLLVGRVYYIRGDLETSLMLYLLGYQFAIFNDKHSLAVKAIHRIAMIESCKRLYMDSKNTFLELTELGELVTPKRKSFAYYRIAKCCFALGELDDSIEYSQKSISIKESYNDRRGLLFSYKMLAKIYFKKQQNTEALFYISQAQSIAKELGLTKEEVSVNLILAKNILKYEIDCTGSNINIEKLLCDSLNIAINEKLLFRIHTIIKLSEGRYIDLYDKAKKQYQLVKQFLECTAKKEQEVYEKYASKHIHELFKKLNNNKSITSSLLIETGIITKELKTLKLNIDDL